MSSSGKPPVSRQPSLQNLGLLGGYDSSSDEDDAAATTNEHATSTRPSETPQGCVQGTETSRSTDGPRIQLTKVSPDVRSTDRMNSLVGYGSGSDDSAQEKGDASLPDSPAPPKPRLGKAKISYPASPNLSPQKSSQIAIERMLRQIQDGKRDGYNVWLRRQKSFKNPKILSKCQRIFGIDQYASNFAKHIYDPGWITKRDSYKALDAAQKKREEEARERRRKRAKPESPHSAANARGLGKKRKRSRFGDASTKVHPKKQRTSGVAGKFTNTILKQLDKKRIRDAERKEALKRRMHGQRDTRPPSERFRDAAAGKVT